MSYLLEIELPDADVAGVIQAAEAAGARLSRSEAGDYGWELDFDVAWSEALVVLTAIHPLIPDEGRLTLRPDVGT